MLTIEAMDTIIYDARGIVPILETPILVRRQLEKIHLIEYEIFKDHFSFIC